jgi:uncharacterized protein
MALTRASLNLRDRARPVTSLESGFDYRCDMASVRLTEDMKRLVRDQRLGFVATVRLDGTPAVSPKGTTSVWDDAHLVFLHLRSPPTVANLEANPHVEVNVVDPIRRKGYRFAGTAEILTSGSRYEEIVAWFGREGGSDYRPRARAVVLITVTYAEALVSPASDDGSTEAEVSAFWRQRYLNLLTRTGD